MIDFMTDPRFNVPDTANVKTLPVEVIGQYVPGKQGDLADLVFYAGDFTNHEVAAKELRRLALEWKALGGVIEHVDADTIKMLNGKTFEPIAFYYIDMKPSDGKKEPWDK